MKKQTLNQMYNKMHTGIMAAQKTSHNKPLTVKRTPQTDIDRGKSKIPPRDTKDRK